MDINKIKGAASSLFSKLKRDGRPFLEKAEAEIRSLESDRALLVLEGLLKPQNPPSREYLAINKKLEAATKEYNEFAARQQAAQAKFEQLNSLK